MIESRGEIGFENNWILILESNWIFQLAYQESKFSFVLCYRCVIQNVLCNVFATGKTFTLGL